MTQCKLVAYLIAISCCIYGFGETKPNALEMREKNSVSSQLQTVCDEPNQKLGREYSYRFWQIQPFFLNPYFGDFLPNLSLGAGFRHVHGYFMSEASGEAYVGELAGGASLNLGGYLYLPIQESVFDSYGGLRISSNLLISHGDAFVAPNLNLVFGVNVKAKDQSKVVRFTEIYFGLITTGISLGVVF